METNLHCKSQHFLPWNPIFKKGTSFRGKIRILTNKAGSLRPVIVSGKKRRRNGSRRLAKFVLESIPIVASKLKILPQPLDMIFEELTGGRGGNGRGWGFKRSSGGDGWFDGWRRRGTRRKLGFWWVLLGFGLGLVLGGETGNDSMYWMLEFGLISFALVEIWKRKAIRDGILGLCFFGILAIFGLQMEVMKNWVRDFQVGSPLVKRFKGGRRKSRAL